MKEHRRHIIAIVVTVFISVTLYAAHTNIDRLFLLQPLLEYNQPFSQDIPIDSIIAWSYNIRTPLNNVIGFSQLIASEPNIDKAIRQEYSNIIHKSSEKLMRLVNDVLDLSRLEAQMMKFQLEDYDATAICKEICYMAQMKNEKTGIKIEYTHKNTSKHESSGSH